MDDTQTLFEVLQEESPDLLPEDMTEEDLFLIMQEKMQRLNRVFQNPVLEMRYRQYLENEDKLLSLDEQIAAMKVRFGEIVTTKKSTMEISSSLRALVDAVGQAVEMRERQQEYVHLEQVLFMYQLFYEIVQEECSRQEDAKKIMKRLSDLTLPRRENIPLSVKAEAKALSQGQRVNNG